MKYYIRDDDGSIVTTTDVMEWATHFNPINRRIAFDRVSDDIVVSTVFLGLDHNFIGQGPPVLWETMIFGGEHDQEVWRYVSEQDAKIKHAIIVDALKNGLDLPE